MPQMSPLNWMTLLMFFLTLMFMFNSFNYFSFLKINTLSPKIHCFKKKINWKW